MHPVLADAGSHEILQAINACIWAPVAGSRCDRLANHVFPFFLETAFGAYFFFRSTTIC